MCRSMPALTPNSRSRHALTQTATTPRPEGTRHPVPGPLQWVRGSFRIWRRAPLQKASSLARLLIGTAIVLGLGLGQAVVIAVAQEATPTPASSIGLIRADPAPLGAVVQAGPVELHVIDVLNGQEAVAAVLAASPTNVEPRDGTTYV